MLDDRSRHDGAPRHAPRPVASPLVGADRLRLREIGAEDAWAIARQADDPRIAMMTRRLPTPYTLADAHGFIAALALGPDRARAVDWRGELVGVVGLNATPDGVPELGYWIGTAFWGRGFGTASAKAMLTEGFADGALDAIAARARVVNVASRLVLERCGFEWTGCVLDRFDSIGASAPVDRFLLTRKRWESQPG